MPTQETRQMVLTAAAICEEKKGEDTRVLELDPADSGFTDFFVITSTTNDRQSVAIADEIELRLKREFGQYANSVEGRRQGEWILLDYVDFVVHIFLAEKRAFYDIERLRKSATPVDLEELKRALTKKTLAARKKAPAKKTATVAKKAAAPAVKKTSAKKAAVKAPAKKAVAKKAAVKKAVAKKTAAKATVKKTPVKKAAIKKAAAKKATKKAAKR
uniref:Ribosomal silencing factor RsfS n=1 Tax=Acidobacterium capsulatum TaxID=33075 RepID=A0A7V4XU68_9BACT